MRSHFRKLCGVDTITPQMHKADCIFRTLFRSAVLDGIATSQLISLASSTTYWLSNL